MAGGAADGGFGGGGGVDPTFEFSAGGGGGYSGGGGGGSDGSGGGGGGSFLSSLASDPTLVAGENAGGGLVSIVSPTVAVPEPSTWAMMLIGLAGLGFAGLRRKHRKSIASA